MANGGDYTNQEYNNQAYNTPPPAAPAPAGGTDPNDPWAGYTFTTQMAQVYYNTLTPEQKAQVDAAGGPSAEWLKNAVAAGVPGAIRAAGGSGPPEGNQENAGGEAGTVMPWENALEPEAWLGKRLPTVPELRKWAHYQHQRYLQGDTTAQDEDYARWSDRVLADQIARGWDISGSWKPGWGTPGAGVPGQGPAPGGGGGGRRKPPPATPAPPPEEPVGVGAAAPVATPAATTPAPDPEAGAGVTPPPPSPGVTFTAGSAGAPPPATTTGLMDVPDVWRSAATAAPPPATPAVGTSGGNRNTFSNPQFFGGNQNNNAGWTNSNAGWVTSDERLKTKGLLRFSDWRS